MVSIGNPGNSGATIANSYSGFYMEAYNRSYGKGAVAHTYSMSKYEVGNELIQWYNNFSDLTPLRTGGFGTWGASGATMTGTNLSYYSALLIVNKINTTQGYSKAYNIPDSRVPSYLNLQSGLEPWNPADDGYNPNNIIRNSGARYFLPTIDEFIKAAYYDPQDESYTWYPGSNDNSAATSMWRGSGTPDDYVSHYGLEQAISNAREWLEPDSIPSIGSNESHWVPVANTVFNDHYNVYGVRLENQITNRQYYSPYYPENMRLIYTEEETLGLTETVPEPSTYAILLGGTVLGYAFWQRRK